MKRYQAALEAAFLAECSPESAYAWLKDHGVQSNKEQDHRWGPSAEEQLLEFILLKRNHKLIDLGLARYGRSPFILRRIYKRGGASVRCAAWLNQSPGGVLSPAGLWCGKDELRELIMAAPKKQLEAFASNPALGDDVLVDLLKRAGLFSDLSEPKYIAVLLALADNTRLGAPYGSNRPLDGFAEYSHNRVFDAAWGLAASVPATQLWAQVLERLLRNCALPVVGLNDSADLVIARWRIDLPIKEGDRHPWHGCSFYLRSILGNLHPADATLRASDDLALRLSFYRRFQPQDFNDWPEWVAQDGEVFADAAIRNTELWRTRDLRDALSRVCWAVPDPTSDMMMPNLFRSFEIAMRKEHPTWFAD